MLAGYDGSLILTPGKKNMEQNVKKKGGEKWEFAYFPFFPSLSLLLALANTNGLPAACACVVQCASILKRGGEKNRRQTKVDSRQQRQRGEIYGRQTQFHPKDKKKSGKKNPRIRREENLFDKRWSRPSISQL